MISTFYFYQNYDKLVLPQHHYYDNSDYFSFCIELDSATVPLNRDNLQYIPTLYNIGSIILLLYL